MVILGATLLVACNPARIAVRAPNAALISVMPNVGGVGVAMLFSTPAQHFLKKRPLSERVRRAAS